MPRPALTTDYRALYRRAFAEFGVVALWNMREVSNPTKEHAQGVARALREHGNLAARQLAEDIESACRAAH
jgi:hypothetical protein